MALAFGWNSAAADQDETSSESDQQCLALPTSERSVQEVVWCRTAIYQVRTTAISNLPSQRWFHKALHDVLQAFGTKVSEKQA
jgi:hypothetical protein